MDFADLAIVVALAMAMMKTVITAIIAVVTVVVAVLVAMIDLVLEGGDRTFATLFNAMETVATGTTADFPII